MTGHLWFALVLAFAAGGLFVTALVWGVLAAGMAAGRRGPLRRTVAMAVALLAAAAVLAVIAVQRAADVPPTRVGGVQGEPTWHESNATKSSDRSGGR